MKQVTRFLAVIAALFLMTIPASAESGFYLSARGGPSFMGKTSNDIKLPAAGLTFDVESEHGVGTAVAGSVGYKMRWGLRLEGEVAWRRNSISRFRVVGVGVPASGSVSSLAGMANIFYDFDNSSRWTPYVGGGLGIARVSINKAAIAVGGGLALANDSATAFAYQAGGGVMFEVFPRLNLMLDVRYFGTRPVTFTHNFGGSFRRSTSSVDVSVGLKYQF